MGEKPLGVVGGKPLGVVRKEAIRHGEKSCFTQGGEED
jgi:hypothetical protein